MSEQLPLKIRQAAEQTIQTLIDHPDFAKYVAEKEIEARVGRGELIHTDKLMVAPGLTLVSATALEDLRNTISDVETFLRRDPPEVDKALTVINTTVDVESIETDETQEVVDVQPDIETEVDDDPEPEAPTGYPTPGKTHRCVKCYTEVDQTFAEMMFVRWREIRCEDHAKTS